MLDIDSIWLAVDNDNGTIGLDPVDEPWSYPGFLSHLRSAASRKVTNPLERADRVKQVLLGRDRAYRSRVAEWAEREFSRRVAEVASRLPIEEHRVLVRRLKVMWAEPLTALLGQGNINTRKRSHAPQDAHWHRWQLLNNRSTKSRSKARKAWLKTHRRSDAQKAAEARYRAKQREAKAAQGVQGAA